MKKKILIVEDEIIIAESIKSALRKFGYDVSGIVSFGEDAVEIAREFHPDLVLMDIQLEGKMNGIEAADIIHSKYDYPIIFLTAQSDEKTIKDASITNPLGYILKPFKENELKVTIEMAFYKHSLEQIQKIFFTKLERLHDIARQLNKCENINKVFQITVRVVQEICKFDDYEYFLSKGDKLETRHGTFDNKDNMSEFNFSRVIAEYILKTQQSLLFKNKKDFPIKIIDGLKINSGISVPIGDMGVFQIFSKKPDFYQKNDLRLIKLLLGHTTEAIRRVRLEQELKAQAIYDPLTNMYNRFYLYKTLEREKQLSKRYNRKIGFLMVDINDLKKVNDNYGHLEGDKVIQIVASILHKEARETDIVIRYGGDEFLILFSETGKEIEHIKKRILKTIDLWNKKYNQFDFDISFAIGSTYWDSKKNNSIEDILAYADKKMYINKKKQKRKQAAHSKLKILKNRDTKK